MDMQNVCLGEKHSIFFKYDSEKLIKAVNEVIEANSDSVIVYIRHVLKRNPITALSPVKVFADSELAECVDGLKIVSDNVFDKYASNAFSNPELHKFLSGENVEVVEVVGLDGGGCASNTAIGAIENGYKVIMNTKAIGTMLKKSRDRLFKKLEKLGAEFV